MANSVDHLFTTNTYFLSTMYYGGPTHYGLIFQNITPLAINNTHSRDFNGSLFQFLSIYITRIWTHGLASLYTHTLFEAMTVEFSTSYSLFWNNRSPRARLPYFTVKAQGLMMFSVRSICRRLFCVGIMVLSVSTFMNLPFLCPY